MASNEIILPSPAMTPDRIGQATAVEQSRAMAEVQAAVYLAQQYPRNQAEAIKSMENTCRQMYVAERAFFRFNRGGGMVTGATIQLAKSLALCWGNIHHGVSELRRDDVYGQSEMQAVAWDLQGNTRVVTGFVVPHTRDVSGRDKDGNDKKPVALIQSRDIYENNANAGARRLREAIWGVIPVWFTETAKTICLATMDAGDGKPLGERIDGAVESYKSIGISVKQLEQKLDLPRIRWTGHDVSQLAVIFTSIKRNEVKVDDEFSPERVTGAEIAAAVLVPPPAPVVAPPVPSTPEPAVSSASSARSSQGGYEITGQTGVTSETLPGPGAPQPQVGRDNRRSTTAQLTAISDLFAEQGVTGMGDRGAALSWLLEDKVEKASDLTYVEADQVLDIMRRMVTEGQFAEMLASARAAA